MRLSLAYVVHGVRRDLDVCSVGHAVQLFSEARDRDGLGASEIGAARVVDLDLCCAVVARISYNGRAWCSRCGDELANLGGLRFCKRHDEPTAALLDRIERGPKRERAEELARRVVAQVSRNLDALHAKQITLEQFSLLQRATWGQLDGKRKAHLLALSSQRALAGLPC